MDIEIVVAHYSRVCPRLRGNVLEVLANAGVGVWRERPSEQFQRSYNLLAPSMGFSSECSQREAKQVPIFFLPAS